MSLENFLTTEQKIKRYEDLLKTRLQDYKIFGKTKEDAEADEKIKNIINKLKETL